MKVFLVDSYKVNIYSLPTKVEDAYLINYTNYSGVDETIALIARDNKWYIESTPDVAISKHNLLVEKDAIEDNNIYEVKFSDLNEIVMLYCYDTPIDYATYEVGNRNIVTLGRAGSYDVLYENTYVYSPHLKIYFDKGSWILEDNGFERTAVYLNNYRVRKAVLHMGDVIFTNGLKIIWLDSFIKVNNPNNAVKSTLSVYQRFGGKDSENVYTPVKDTEKAIVLYNDNQVFFHTPRMKAEIKETIISIDSPPDEIKDESPPAILTLGATIMMGISSSLTGVIAIFSVATGRATLLSSITEITICLSMLVGTIMFPVLLDRYQKKKLKKKEKLRQTKYMTYLDSKRKEIQDAILLETKILYENNLSILECQNNLINKTNKVWSREIQDNDFLTIRLGIGDKNADIKIEAHKKDFSMDDDNLRKEVEKILNEKQILKNVPVTVSLIQNKVLPIIIDNTYYYRQSFIDSILLQIITYYSGADLKLVVFTNQDNASRWEYLKYLPHCCSDDRKTRFFATNEDEMKQLSTYLEREFQSRWDLANNKHQDSLENEDIDLENEDDENIYAAFDKYYLIITDNFVNSKGYGIIDKVVNRKQNVGFSLMMIEPNMANIPSKINKFIEVNNNVAHILGKDLSESDQNNFVPELFNGDITLFANILANIPVSSTNMINSLPTTINFLEMYKVGKIEQLNILNRWTNNNPTISLHAPVGVHEDGKLFEIDLHEKFHGPHGLVAGATGSGKSEFIITYILSMALNYHPYEVQFVLIDYKGGGLAGAFENKESGIKLPHLAGTITNLDTGEMNRTLVSINSELKRRQRMFNEARDALNESTVDIYKYQRFYREGKVKEPISHLFIISDEFAELKAQQPDFMNELVSTARIGRSLGVHLILATQKPAGVVDDQIWSNSRFKVCLKVQTAEDSMELLKRSDAAEIKETGRFYLQVGFNELFELGQSAWAGARYIPTDRILKSIDDSINFIDNNGNIIKRVNDSVKVENQTNYGDQLTNIVGALYNIAIRENVKFNQLWLPSISKEIYLSQIVNKYGYSPVAYEINPIIGEYDNPASQFQGLLTVDLTNKGNLLIVGNAGSGKENLLTTLIYSTCLYHSSEEVNFYILDYGAEVLRIFNNVAHVGDVAVVDDDEKIKGLLLMLDREQKKRKDLFAEYGGGYTSYIKNSGNNLPLIVVVLNGYESFVENYAKYDDILVHLLRDSSKYGIVFVMTAIAINSVRSSLQQLFNNKIALQLSDSFDYKYYLNAPDNMTPSKYFGRGIVAMDDTAYEFQTAYVYLRDNINDVIKDFAIKLSKVQKKVPKIPVIPSIVNADSLTPYIEEVTNVPIGFNMDDASVCKYDFTKNKITQITGNYIIRDNTFVQELIKVLSTVSNIKFKIIDFVDYVSDFDGLDYSNGNFTDTIKNIIKTEQEESKTIVYLFVGIGHIYDKVLDEGILTLFNIFSNIDKFLNSYFIIADNYSSYKRIMKEEWYLNFVNKSSGIWVGTDVSVQNAILFDNLSKADSNEDFSSLAYADSDNDYSVIKAIGANERNDLY